MQRLPLKASAGVITVTAAGYAFAVRPLGSENTGHYPLEALPEGKEEERLWVTGPGWHHPRASFSRLLLKVGPGGGKDEDRWEVLIAETPEEWATGPHAPDKRAAEVLCLGTIPEYGTGLDAGAYFLKGDGSLAAVSAPPAPFDITGASRVRLLVKGGIYNEGHPVPVSVVLEGAWDASPDAARCAPECRGILSELRALGDRDVTDVLTLGEYKFRDERAGWAFPDDFKERATATGDKYPPAAFRAYATLPTRHVRVRLEVGAPGRGPGMPPGFRAVRSFTVRLELERRVDGSGWSAQSW
jgi:hypothetical protein